MKSFMAILISFLFASFISASENNEGKSYIPHSQPFLLIDDVNRQAEAWATCVAVWQIMSEIFNESKAQADEYSNLGNGAKIAIVMTFVSTVISEDKPNPNKFSSTWTLAKTNTI